MKKITILIFLFRITLVLFLGCTTSDEKIQEQNTVNDKYILKDINGTTLKLVKILGGTFKMGIDTGKESERPVHNVVVKDFYLGETEITMGQYVAFLNERKPSDQVRKEWIAIRGEPVDRWSGALGWLVRDKDDNFPIVYENGEYFVDESWQNNPVFYVSWFGADAFCKFYGLRLPSEEEWEYAAGGPNHYIWSLGNSFEGQKYCYVNNPAIGYPLSVPVTNLPANGFGLYEMSGNVYEWCNDYFKDYGKTENSDLNKSEGYNYKIVRGGSWATPEDFLRCSARITDHPAHQSNIVGFRVAANY